MGFIPLGQEKQRGFIPLEAEEPKESLLKSTAKGFAKGGATFMPKAFWGGVKVLKDVANQYPAFTPWAAGTQLIPEGYPERQIAEVEKTAEYLTPEERKGWTQYIPKAAETLGQMAGSAVSTAGVGTLLAMAVGAGIDRTLRTQKEGESLPKSLLAGGMSGTAEYFTEKLPIKYLTQIGLPYLKRLAGGLISDVPGEIYETFIEMKSIDEGLLGKKYTPQEYAKAILDTAATSAMTTGIATTAVQPFKGMPPKRPFIPEAEEVVLPPGEKPLLPSTQEPIKQTKGFTPLTQPEIPITRPKLDLLAAQQPLPKPENVEIVKPQIPIDEAIQMQREKIALIVNPIDRVFENKSLEMLLEAKKMGRETIPSDYFKTKEKKIWKPKEKILAQPKGFTPIEASPIYQPRGLKEAITIRKEMGSLAGYDLQSQTEWLGGQKPKDEITIYRATPTGEEIKSGDYVTNSLEYAKQHIQNNLGGKGIITKAKATLDDIFPADAPKEFWYAPKSIELQQTHTMPSGEVMSGAEHKEILEAAQTENIFQQIKKITSAIKIDKGFFDHFDRTEVRPIVQKSPGLFSTKKGMPLDEVADGLSISTDELASKLRDAVSKKKETELLKKQIQEYRPPIPQVIVGELGLKVGDKFKIHGEQYTVKERDAEGNFLIEDGDKFIVDEFDTIPQPDEGSIQIGKVKYSQPKMFEGEKTNIVPKMEAEIQGQQKLFNPKGEIVKEPTNLETFGFQSMYEAGEKLVKNASEYVKAQQEYKKILKEGGVTEDIPHDIGKFKQFISFPHTIAKRFPKTKVFQERTYQQVEQFENLVGDLKDNLDSYIKNHDNKVDQALIEGYVSPTPKLFSDQELNARGLSQEEIQAYRAVSPTMKAAAKVLEQHLLKVGKDPQEVQAWMADFQESYIPLSRYGEFYVSVKDAQDNGISTPTFDNVGQARKAVVDLRRQYPNLKITMGNVKRLAPEAYEGMPLNVLAFLSKFDENLSANFASVIGKGFPGHLLQVKKTPGFETNLKKSISDYVMSLARYVSINEYQRDITNMFDYEKSGIVDPKREAGLWGYWKRYSDYIVSNPKEFAKFRQFFYYYYLGANIKSALLNATQPLTTTYPVLSKYAKQPEMLMAKAFKLATHTQKGLMKINPELAYAVQSAIHDGTISEQNINELRGLQQGKSASKIGNALSFLFSSAEKFNRKVSFIAMYMAAREGYLKNGQQRSHAEIQKVAEDFVKETQYDYRKVDRPELARGWRAPLFTFRMFSGNYLSMLKNLMVEKKFAALARSLGVMLILGGVSAIPGWKELEKALELMGYDPKKSFREYMGKEQGELALHGLPFKTGGNISGALGTIELLPGDIQQGVTAGIANLVLGVPTDIPKRFDRARQYLFKLNSPYRAVEAVMPEFVRNPMVAIRWIREEGIRSPKFEKLGTATNKDIFFKAIGIQPSNLTNIYEQKHSAIVIKNRVTRNTEEYNFRLARALYGNDIEEYKKTMDEIIRHNQKSKSELDLIIPDKSSVKRQVQGMYDSGVKDIKEMPKRGRRALMELEEVY